MTGVRVRMLNTEVSTAIQAFLVKARRVMPIERAVVDRCRTRGDAYLNDWPFSVSVVMSMPLLWPTLSSGYLLY